MSGGCWCCDGPVERRHHPSGRDHENRYLDSGLRAPVCHDDHELVHDDWRTQRIERVEGPLSGFERASLRLRRTAASFARMRSEHFDADPTEIAETLVAWAEELDRGIRHLDEALPRWREDPGFR